METTMTRYVIPLQTRTSKNTAPFRRKKHKRPASRRKNNAGDSNRMKPYHANHPRVMCSPRPQLKPCSILVSGIASQGP